MRLDTLKTGTVWFDGKPIEELATDDLISALEALNQKKESGKCLVTELREQGRVIAAEIKRRKIVVFGKPEGFSILEDCV
jgi:ABC-type cobalamin/Fe3+-siderophores transport system ATPase subunit